VAEASTLPGISPVLPQNATLSLSPILSSDSKQQQLPDSSVQNQSSSRLSSVVDNDGNGNLTMNSDKLLKDSKNMITSDSGMPNDMTSNDLEEKFSATLNNNNSRNVNDIDNSVANQFSESNTIPAVQGTEQPFQLFQEQQHPPQQSFDDGKGQEVQEGQVAEVPQQSYQKQGSQELPFYSSSPAEGLIPLRSEGIGLGATENGTAAATNEIFRGYSSQVFPPVLPTAPAPEPLLEPSQQFLPPTTLAAPLYSSATNPPDTFITSAIDNSTRLSIQNGPITTSDSITLTFWGIGDLGINGYMCSIDDLAAFTCSSPIVLDSNIFQTIQFGSITSVIHTFQVSAIDRSGIIDPTPAIFSWIMTEPSAMEPVPSESLTLTQTPNTGTSSSPVPPPQQPDASQQLLEQQQQIQSQTTVPEQLPPEAILPPNPIESLHIPPQTTIPAIQAPFVALQ
jgi:hypothetical protein